MLLMTENVLISKIRVICFVENHKINKYGYEKIFFL